MEILQMVVSALGPFSLALLLVFIFLVSKKQRA
jgi:hypothetical protein